MRPFIVTATQARKLPRWGLLLLCVLYVVPGFVGRDPWRTADATGFGLGYTMFSGRLTDWLMPNVAGAAVYEDGPLPYALSALFARAAVALSNIVATIHPALSISPHLAMRIAAALGLALLLAFVWRSMYLLARRPGFMPADPIGASASPTDFARALADSSLLITLAIFGLITRMHETTATAAQVTWIAGFMYGAARSLEYPTRGSWIAGLAIAATSATGGLPTAGALLLTWLCLPALSQQFRLVALQNLRIGVSVALIGSAIWPVTLWLMNTEQSLSHLANWLQWNTSSIGLPDAKSVSWALRYMPWFFWPAWPLAIWALYRWRGRLEQPAIALPLILAGSLMLLTLCATQPGEQWLLPVTLPIALLATAGLPTLKRGVVNLIDWFAVMFFSLFGFTIWAYWIAYLSGWPPRMAYSVDRLVPGFLPQWSKLDLILALAASLAWVLLVQWRISRRPPVIWRAVVLSSGGLCLAWFLLMTLWLPVFNERNTYRHVAMNIKRHISDGQCVQARSVGMAERASFAYFANLKFAGDDQSCDFLLVEDYGATAQRPASDEPGWTLTWEGRRRANRKERFRLYKLND
ncbi:MAG: glycosyltransferase family 39 protein [Burkholderiaceae bacterium]